MVRSAGGVELVRKLAEEGRRVFTAEDSRRVAPAVRLSPGYLRQALHHLVRSGWIVRIKNGVYGVSGAMPGTAPLHEFEIAMALVSPAAISHWSAMSHHGMTEQTPRRVFVLTSARSVPRVRRRGRKGWYRVSSTPYQFVQVRPGRFFGVQQVWVNEARVGITDPERTLLDGLMAPDYCGDFAEVLHAFEARGPRLDVDRAVGYALKLDAAVAKRLGWILERQGVAPARLAALRKMPVKGTRLLDPTGPRRGRVDAGWMIQVNAPGPGRP
jgi:predicted transcriptional regulator of viral defense system